MTQQAEQLMKYSVSIAQEFKWRMNRLRFFVKNNVASGNANEVILRDFLASHSPGDFAVGQGFICNPLEQDKVSSQCDILVYHQNAFPLVYSDGPVKVVWPYAAYMVIEAKTRLKDKKTFKEALGNIASAKATNDRICGVIFAFDTLTVKKTIEHLETYPDPIPEKHKPDVIFLLDKGVIIHRWGWSRSRDVDNDPNTDPQKYAVLVAKNGDNAIVIAFLLLLFFEAVGGGSGIYLADVVNLAMRLLEQHTDKQQPDISIGK